MEYHERNVTIRTGESLLRHSLQLSRSIVCLYLSVSRIGANFGHPVLVNNSYKGFPSSRCKCKNKCRGTSTDLPERHRGRHNRSYFISLVTTDSVRSVYDRNEGTMEQVTWRKRRVTRSPIIGVSRFNVFVCAENAGIYCMLVEKRIVRRTSTLIPEVKMLCQGKVGSVGKETKGIR